MNAGMRLCCAKYGYFFENAAGVALLVKNLRDLLKKSGFSRRSLFEEVFGDNAEDQTVQYIYLVRGDPGDLLLQFVTIYVVTDRLKKAKEYRLSVLHNLHDPALRERVAEYLADLNNDPGGFPPRSLPSHWQDFLREPVHPLCGRSVPFVVSPQCVQESFLKL